MEPDLVAGPGDARAVGQRPRPRPTPLPLPYPVLFADRVVGADRRGDGAAGRARLQPARRATSRVSRPRAKLPVACAHGITVAVRHPGRRPRCARPAQRRRPAHAPRVQPRPRRPRRRRGLPQVREPPARRLAQIRGAYTRMARLSDEEKSRGSSRPAPATTGAWPGSADARHQGQGLHAARRADAQAGGDRAYGAGHRAGRHDHRRVPGQGPGVGGEHRRGADPPLRPPRHRRRPGHLRPRDPAGVRTCARSW